MMMKITRTITKAEQPWMEDGEIYRAGTIVYPYHGCTYGCIGEGVAVSLENGQTPFFEVPVDALEEA